jgi:ribosomal protein L16 Arg81 hydroxylase
MPEEVIHAGPQAASDAFPRLLRPIDPDVFLRDHWERQALYIPGDPSKFAELAFDRAAFRRAAAACRSLKAAFRDDHGYHREVTARADEIDALFAAGRTLCVSAAERSHPPLAGLARGAKAWLHLAGHALFNCYWSPPSAGFGMHFDDRSVFILQLEGSKHFQYSVQPALASPPRNLCADPDDLARFRIAYPWASIAPPASLAEATLSPGDVLYLPAGCWHAAAAWDGDSLGATLNCVPWTVRELVFEVLTPLLEGDPAWRRDLPAVAPGAMRRASAPVELERLIEDRLAALRAVVQRVTPGELVERWRGRVAGVPAALDPGPSGSIEPGDRLQLVEPLSYFEAIDDGAPALHLYCGSRALSVPIENLPFIRVLARQTTFAARDAMAFCEPGELLAWDEVREALELLLEHGVVHRTLAR